MRVYGNGRVALADDPHMAERLGWPERRRSEPDAELLLRPAAGDPAREPWITRRRRPLRGPEALWTRDPERPAGTYLDVPGVERHLKAMAQPRRPHGFTVAIDGLGRVGGLGATALAVVETAASGIGTILVHDADPANLERMRLELGSIAAWRGTADLPRVEAAGLAEMLQRADAFLFAAATAVPPLGSEGDVRMPQFGPNREALRPALQAAAEVAYAGLFCIISDPVEWLAQAAFHDSNLEPDGAEPPETDPAVPAAGRFGGAGLAPERVCGLALNVMWGRALALAGELGVADRVRRHGAAYGPHSTQVLVVDDTARPDPDLSARLTEAARTGNYRIRGLGYLPYIGPAMSSIVNTLPPLLGGREVLASHWLDGIYFGAPCRLEWGLESAPGVIAHPVREQLRELHSCLFGRMERAGLVFRAAAAAPGPAATVPGAANNPLAEAGILGLTRS
jgi:hypothetical protein